MQALPRNPSLKITLPLASEVAKTLNSAGYVVGYWGSSKLTERSMTGVAAPVRGTMTGTDGRSYAGISRYESFTVTAHPHLVYEAAYGLRRSWSRIQRELCDQLQAIYGIALPQAVTMVAAYGTGVVAARSSRRTLEGISATKHAENSRRALADQAYESYDFGDGAIVEDQSGWEYTTPGNEMVRTVFVRMDADCDTIRLRFVVRFGEDQRVAEAYSIACTSPAT